MRRTIYSWWSPHRTQLASVLLTLATFTGCRFQLGDGDVNWNSRVEDQRRNLALDGYDLHRHG